MNTFRLACVIEGKGERSALPVLLRRIADELTGYTTRLEITTVHLDRSKLTKAGELERAVQLAAQRAGAPGAILILHDADDACPVQLRDQVRDRAAAARADRLISVVLANKEFEAWFIASADSLKEQGYIAGVTDLPEEDPDSVRGAKQWLSSRLHQGTYKPTVDQPKLAAVFDLQEARRNSRSFRKLWREMELLLAPWISPTN